jgi:tetratricopeptide (TPR) repeat protein
MSFLADALWRAGKTADAGNAAEEATAIARESGDVRTLAHVLSVRARVTPDLQEKKRSFVEAVDAYRSIDSRQGMVKALLQIAECAFEAGDAAAALRSARECIASLYEGVEAEQHPLTIVRNNAAAYALALGHVDEARAFAIGALALAQRIGDRRRAAWALQHLAGVAFERGEMERAARLLGASEESLRLAITRERSFTETSGHQKVSAGLAGAFTERQLAELTAQGRRWTTEEAMAEA